MAVGVGTLEAFFFPNTPKLPSEVLSPPGSPNPSQAALKKHRASGGSEDFPGDTLQDNSVQMTYLSYQRAGLRNIAAFQFFYEKLIV